MRQRCRGGQIGRPRTDRGGDSHHPAPLHLFGIGDSDMRHALLVMAAICRQLITHAVKCLTKTGDVAMAENRPDTSKGRRRTAVELLDGLCGHPAGQCLRHRQTNRCHLSFLP